MSNQRINIIIQEINYWKEHKILPDMYCDFLLALYTKGENEIQTLTNDKAAPIGLVSLLQLIIQFFILLATVVLINIQHVTLSFQVLFLVLSFIGMFWLYKLQSDRRDILFQLSVMILLVELFLVSVLFSKQFIYVEWLTHIIILGNFVYWLFIGYQYKLKYLQVIAGILMVFTTFYMFL